MGDLLDSKTRWREHIIVVPLLRSRRSEATSGTTIRWNLEISLGMIRAMSPSNGYPVGYESEAALSTYPGNPLGGALSDSWTMSLACAGL